MCHSSKSSFFFKFELNFIDFKVLKYTKIVFLWTLVCSDDYKFQTNCSRSFRTIFNFTTKMRERVSIVVVMKYHLILYDTMVIIV